MPDAQVITDMLAFKQQLLRSEKAQMTRMARRWLELERSLSDQIELLAIDMENRRKAGLPISQTSLFRMERWQALLQQMENEYGKYAEFATEEITAGQVEFGTAGVNQAIATSNAVASKAVIGTFNQLPTQAVTLAAGLVGDGTPLSQWLTRNTITDEMALKVSSTLLNAIAQGWNPRKTAKAMQDSLAGGLQQALNTARTEQMRVYREMNRQQMINSGVIVGYRRLATRDNRVCAACMMDDGTFYPLDKPMPEHNQGRCAMVPVVDGARPVQWQYGRDRFGTLPADDQKKILGSGRYEAWKNGEFELDQLVSKRVDDVWGDSIHPTPLNQLGA